MRWVWFSAVAVLGTALDLFTKWIMFSRLKMGEPHELIPGILYLELSLNEGAAFGLFPGQIAFFIIVSAIAISAMIYFVATAEPDARLLPLTLGLLLAGVCGNLYDRVADGKVRDFILVRCDHEPVHGWLMTVFGKSQWPNFNVADTCICVGAALIVIIFWRDERREKREKAAAEAAEKAKADPAPPPAPAAGEGAAVGGEATASPGGA